MFTLQEGPVLELPPRPVVIQSAAWSPWQSSVIAIGLADGLVEIWDIIQSTSRPQRQIRISRSTITGELLTISFLELDGFNNKSLVLINSHSVR